MGTSFVEYKGFGFWTRDSYLESWLTTLLEEMGKLPTPQPWQKSLMEHWRIQIIVGGGVMSLQMDEFLTDSTRKDFVLSLSKAALKPCERLGRRTGELFVDLLACELKTTASTPIDFLDDPRVN